MPGIVTVGEDMIEEHCAPFLGCHASTYMTGSPNVKVNGKPVVRMDDPITCGDTALTGSDNVKVNGKPVHRKGDTTVGHPPWPPTIAATGSSNVRANGE